MRLFAAILLVVAVACGSTEPVLDPSTTPVDGTYTLAAQGTACGCDVFIPGDATHMDADQYQLSGGTWTRAYSATSTSPDGTKRPYSGTLSGTYLRSGTAITLSRSGATDLQATFTGRGLRVVEGIYLYTYDKR